MSCGRGGCRDSVRSWGHISVESKTVFWTMAGFISGLNVCVKGSSSTRVCRRRTRVSSGTGSEGGDGVGGDLVVQEALERALRKSMREMRESGEYGEKETDEIRRLGEAQIRGLADTLKEELEEYRQVERQRAVDSEATKKMEQLLAKFDKQAEELVAKMDREQDIVLEEAERIRALTEELATMRKDRSGGSPKLAILFFLSWGFGIGAVFYAWRGIDSGYLAEGLTNAGFDAAVTAVCAYLYLKEKKAESAKN